MVARPYKKKRRRTQDAKILSHVIHTRFVLSPDFKNQLFMEALSHKAEPLDRELRMRKRAKTQEDNEREHRRECLTRVAALFLSSDTSELELVLGSGKGVTMRTYEAVVRVLDQAVDKGHARLQHHRKQVDFFFPDSPVRCRYEAGKPCQMIEKSSIEKVVCLVGGQTASVLLKQEKPTQTMFRDLPSPNFVRIQDRRDYLTSKAVYSVKRVWQGVGKSEALSKICRFEIEIEAVRPLGQTSSAKWSAEEVSRATDVAQNLYLSAHRLLGLSAEW